MRDTCRLIQSAGYLYWRYTFASHISPGTFWILYEPIHIWQSTKYTWNIPIASHKAPGTEKEDNHQCFRHWPSVVSLPSPRNMIHVVKVHDCISCLCVCWIHVVKHPDSIPYGTRYRKGRQPPVSLSIVMLSLSSSRNMKWSWCIVQAWITPKPWCADHPFTSSQLI